MFFAALALGAVATAFFLYLRVTKGGIKAMFAKTAASIFFILTAVFACIETDYSFIATRQYGIYIIVGLVFGMLGDIWLDLKYCYKDDSDAFTYAGMVCFAIGHFFYMYAVCSVSGLLDSGVWYVIVPVAAGIVFGVVAVSLDKLMKLDYGKFKMISGAYGAVLSTMTFLSFSAYVASGFRADIWLVMTIGGVFFIISDLVLSGMYFDKEMSKNTTTNVIINHITYYISQFVIASSVMFFA
jgi:YhhN-like protein.